MTIINVGSLNTAGSRNPEGVRELKEAFHLDILALQEVDKRAARSDWKDVAREIAGQDAQADFAEAMRFGHLNRAAASGDTSYKAPATGADTDALFGVALISRHPFTSERIFLGPTPDKYWAEQQRMAQREIEPRSVIVAKISVGEKPIWAMSGHLAYTKDRAQPSEVRRNQIGQLLEFVDGRIPPRDPLIVMLDTNATPTNPDMKPFFDRFKTSPVLTYPVSQNETPDRQIDYQFVRNLNPVTPLRTYRDPNISDHAALLGAYAL